MTLRNTSLLLNSISQKCGLLRFCSEGEILVSTYKSNKEQIAVLHIMLHNYKFIKPRAFEHIQIQILVLTSSVELQCNNYNCA